MNKVELNRKKKIQMYNSQKTLYNAVGAYLAQRPWCRSVCFCACPQPDCCRACLSSACQHPQTTSPCLHPESISRPRFMHTNGIKLFAKRSCKVFPCGEREQKTARAFEQQQHRRKGPCGHSWPVATGAALHRPAQAMPAYSGLSLGTAEGGWSRRSLHLICTLRTVGHCSRRVSAAPVTLHFTQISQQRSWEAQCPTQSANIVEDHFFTKIHFFSEIISV